MAIGFDNPNPISDGALFYLADTAGFRQLFQVETVSSTMEGGVSNVMGPAGVIGNVRAPGGFTLSLTTRRASGVPDEADWDGLRDDDEIFRFEIQYLGSTRVQFINCRVATINDSVGADGNVTREVSITATSRNNIQP
jgi:hypothetical protein